MVRTTMYRVVSVLMVLSVVGVFVQVGEAAQYKVLVVMSYEEDNPWCEDIKKGIDSVLASHAEMKYVYMDTKKDFEGGPQKAKEAYALYQEFQPDGVITADDNAQPMFVLPYLKDKVDTPVMFCGVNAEAEKYGYPASNVSGILERAPINVSLAFVKQLVPSIKTVGFIVKDSPSGRALSRQVEGEADTYPMKYTTFKFPKTLKETVSMVEELKGQCDVLFMDSMEGITDEDDKPLKNKEITQIVTKAFEKPMIGSNRYHVEHGILCAAIKTGYEQGETAAHMLLQAMQGTPVSEILITENKKGKRLLNVDTMKSLGIKPKPHVLQGVELVKTEE